MTNLATPSIPHTMQHLKSHSGVVCDESAWDKSTLGVRDVIWEDYFNMVGKYLRNNPRDYVV